MPDYAPWSPEKAVEVIVSKADMDGALMPILHALNETFGYVPDEAVPLIAGVLNLSRADVHGTLTFYHDFRRKPAPRHVVKLCQAEACQARGSVALTAHAEQTLGTHIDPHGHANKRGVSLEPIYCLGLCASGPNALIDGRPHARLTPERLDALTAELV
ncbi:MAG: formate dehydrogenase subunit gamma [Caulobacteraceae bacterium]